MNAWLASLSSSFTAQVVFVNVLSFNLSDHFMIFLPSYPVFMLEAVAEVDAVLG